MLAPYVVGDKQSADAGWQQPVPSNAAALAFREALRRYDRRSTACNALYEIGEPSYISTAADVGSSKENLIARDEIDLAWCRCNTSTERVWQ